MLELLVRQVHVFTSLAAERHLKFCEAVPKFVRVATYEVVVHLAVQVEVEQGD